MATRTTIEKIMRNWKAYYLAYDSTIEIQRNGVKVKDFSLNQANDDVINILVPTNADFVDLSTAQTIGWVKTFSNELVLPNKTTDATNSWTAPATESQVYKKQDKLTLPSTPTSWHMVGRWANNKTLVDLWAVPTTPVASDFDIKDLADSTGLRTIWSGKQDNLTAWNNIVIQEVSWVLTISATDTTYTEITKSAIDTWTSTTAWVISAKTISDYVNSRVWSAVNYQWQVNTYADLPANPSKGDMYNVVQAHTTAPTFDAWTNVVWNGTSWDPMAEMVDLSNLVDKSTNQTIGGIKTFSNDPVLPSKSSLPVSPSNTAPATEWQLKSVKDLISPVNNTTITIQQPWETGQTFTTNQASASTISLIWNLMKSEAEYTALPSSKNSDWNRYFITNEVEEA